jgi:hypothetical protein
VRIGSVIARASLPSICAAPRPSIAAIARSIREYSCANVVSSSSNFGGSIPASRNAPF